MAGCLPVFSLAGLHTAAWQQKAGQLNSLDGEKRGRGEEEEEERGQEERWRDRKGPGALVGTHIHTSTATCTKRVFTCPLRPV